MAKKATLHLLDANSQDVQLKINLQFADKYESKKRKEEIQLLEEKYQGIQEKGTKADGASVSDASFSDEDSEEDEDEDEVGELVTPEVDAQILKTISSIKAKRADIYNPESSFFSPAEMNHIRSEWKAKQVEQKKRGEKPMTLKEYRSKMLLEGHLNGDAEDCHDGDGLVTGKTSKLPTFVEEQESLKNAIKKAIHNIPDSTSYDELLLVKKEKTAQELQFEEDEYKKFLLENLATEASAETTMQNWLHYKEQSGHSGTQGVKATDEEGFLINYILNRGWIDKSNKTSFPGFLGEGDSEDEAYLEKAEEFETNYNFRFEQEGGHQIMTHARMIKGLIRKTDDTRKLKRLEKQEKKKARKLIETEELKRLKNLKKQELAERLKMIQKVAGSSVVDEALLSELDEEFDSDKFDQKMAHMFDEGYYQMNEDDSDEVTETPEDLQEIFQEIDEREMRATKKLNAQSSDAKTMTKSLSETANRLENEYYQLHYEDKIEDLPTRFRYRSVKSSNFGLQVSDVLTIDDKLLKQHVSLKKLAPYKSVEEQEQDIQKYGKKKRLCKLYDSLRKKEKKEKEKEPQASA